jgi:hypothetical protein
MNSVAFGITARQRVRQGSVRAADVGDARAGAEPDAGAQGRQEPRAARADACRHRRTVLSQLLHTLKAFLVSCGFAHARGLDRMRSTRKE